LKEDNGFPWSSEKYYNTYPLMIIRGTIESWSKFEYIPTLDIKKTSVTETFRVVMSLQKTIRLFFGNFFIVFA